jgi:hypothetical protein
MRQSAAILFLVLPGVLNQVKMGNVPPQERRVLMELFGRREATGGRIAMDGAPTNRSATGTASGAIFPAALRAGRLS